MGNIIGSFCGERILSGDNCGYLYNPINKKTSQKNIEKPALQCGSVIKVDDFTVEENIPLIGTAFLLNYSSGRSPARGDLLNFELDIAQPKASANASNVIVTHTRFGIDHVASFPANADANYTYLWDGLDGLGNPSLGGCAGKLKVEYEQSGGTKLLVHDVDTKIANFNPIVLGLGGLTISQVHFLDLASNTFYQGDGSKRAVTPIPAIKTVGGKYTKEETSFDHYIVASKDASEVFIFNLVGFHVETRSDLTGGKLWDIAYVGSKISSVIDSFNNALSVTRTASTVTLTNQYGTATVLALDASGRATSVTTPGLDQYQLSYGANGLMSTFTKSTGLVSTFTYQADGRLISDSNSSGFSKTLNSLYDGGSERETNLTTAEGVTTNYKIAFYGDNVGTQTTIYPDYSYKETSYQDNSYAITSPKTADISVGFTDDPRFDDQIENVTYHSVYSGYIQRSVSLSKTTTPELGNLLNVSAQTSNYTKQSDYTTWTNTYSGANKTFTKQSPLGQTSTLEINDFNQVVRAQYASLHPAVYTYDVSGRLQNIQVSDRDYDFEYNTAGLVSKITNPLLEETTYQYDSSNRLIGIDGLDTEFTNDANGNISGVKPSGGTFFNLAYYLTDLIKDFVFPSAAKISYNYDNDGRVTQIVKPNLDTIDYTYNYYGQLDNISSPEGNYARTYKYGGLLQEVQSPDLVQVRFNYTTDRLTEHKITYQAYATSRVINHNDSLLLSSESLTTSPGNLNSTVAYSYNDDELLISAGDMTFQRTAATGFKSGATLLNVQDSFFYSSFGELQEQSSAISSVDVFKNLYTRDKLGRITQNVETISGVTNTYDYQYDSDGRLTQVSTNAVVTRIYTYDSNGNRLSQLAGGVTTAATYGVDDQILTYGDYSFVHSGSEYIAQKNNAVAGIDATYEYNSVGALTSAAIDDNGVVTNVAYINDGLGRRISKSVNGVFSTRYIFDEDIRLIGETDETGTFITHYVYGTKLNSPEYMIKNGEKYKFVSDQVGSTRLVIKASDNSIVQRIDYDEFGNVLSDTNPGFQPFYFAGGLYDQETRLLRFGARDYDAEIGRWTSKDPILFSGGDTNLFGYVGNDPINYIDPDGLERITFNNNNLTLYDDNGGVLFKGPGISGPFGNGALPSGNYNANNFRDNRGGSFSCSGDSGYSLDLNPTFKTDRTLLRIHPDGGKRGTLGCIGVSCQSGGADKLGDILRNRFKKNPWLNIPTEVR